MPEPTAVRPRLLSGAPRRARRSSSSPDEESLGLAGRWRAFWAAGPLSRLYLVAGSVILLVSAASDLGLIGGEAFATAPLDVAVIVSTTAAFLAQWWRSTVGFALLVPAGAATIAGGTEALVTLVTAAMLAAVTVTARSWAFVVAAATLALAWGVVRPVASGRPSEAWFVLALMTAGLGVGLFIRESVARRERDRRRILEAEERARLAAERERRSLARDLHDVVAHNLTIISMQARTAQYLGTPEAAQSVLAVVGDSAKDALVDLRRMLAILQEDGIVDPAGEPGAAGGADGATAADLALTAGRMAAELRSLGMSVERDLRFDPEAVPMSVRSALHRVLQEATTNAAKHAGAGAEVRIMVAEQGRDVVLEVENSVAAPQRSMRWNSSGVGLQSMRDRVATFGGTLEAGPGGRGWLVRAAIPRAPEGA